MATLYTHYVHCPKASVEVPNRVLVTGYRVEYSSSRLLSLSFLIIKKKRVVGDITSKTFVFKIKESNWHSFICLHWAGDAIFYMMNLPLAEDEIQKCFLSFFLQTMTVFLLAREWLSTGLYSSQRS